MPRQTGINVENDFRKGLITEATALNFPPNSVIDTLNCEFEWDASVRRRLGFDFETGHETKTINRANSVVSSYLWKNVSGNGDVSLQVVQVGATVYFYRTDAGAFSAGAVADTVTLTAVSGATQALVATKEAQYSDGNGYLFITHPNCDPIRVAFDITSDTATDTSITIKVRDFEGDTADPNAVDTRPTATLAGLNVAHKYNLYNQGWTTTNLTAWDTAQTTMPSNADVMWQFKDSSDDFDASSASIARVTAGNTPAISGHFIVTLSNYDRDTTSGLSGVTNRTTSTERPATSAFFAGRIFYSGINYAGVHNNIYFSQIVEKDSQYGACHQINDPTSEDLFDLLPSDGGVIRIQEAGTIYKLVTVPGGLCAFAANGVWFITGSTGLGFTAVDYTVQKISTIPTLSATSFVNVNGYPSWWNADAIYVMAPAQGAIPQIQPITVGTIDTYYDDIPLVSKRFARGVYHTTDKHIRWIFRTEGTDDITTQYEFDAALNFNVVNQSFFPWSISTSDVKVNSILVSDLTSGTVESFDVVDGVDNVIDDSGNNVIAFLSDGLEESPFDKYLVSYSEAGSYEFTFADKINADYIDWFTYDLEGVNYDSYFITGYRILGQASNRFQNNWVRVYSRTDEPVSYYFQGLWNYALTGNTGKWSSRQLIEHDDTDYSFASKRLKVRGSGLALQLKVESVDGEPFDIVGWSAMQSANSIP
jgi:hypothetical protein